MKHFALENKLLKLSYESWYIKFRLETRELWLKEFDPAAV